ncbi:MAG: F0F1 ATP synthase subunit B' [Xanthobacteraceae bacterium]
MAQPTHAATEAAQAATEAAHAATGGFPPFNAGTFPSQLLWFAICFVALYVMVARVALPRMGEIFAQRRAKIDADFAEAARMKGDADAAVEAHEKARADAHARAHALAIEAREKAAAESEAHRKSVEEGLQQRLVEAEKQIAASKTAAMAKVRDIAIETTGAIVTHLIGTPPSDGAVTAAVDETLKR